MSGPSCGISLAPPTLAPVSLVKEPTRQSVVSFPQSCQNTNMTPSKKKTMSHNLKDYIKFSDEKSPYFQGNNLIVPGAKLTIPDFEEKYEKKLEKQFANIATLNNAERLKVKDSLNYFVHLCIILQIVIFIIIIVWVLYRAFFQ